jgi:hypothetical protein
MFWLVKSYDFTSQNTILTTLDGDSAKLANWLAERARIPVSVSHSTVALSKALVLDCQEQIKAKPWQSLWP